MYVHDIKVFAKHFFKKFETLMDTIRIYSQDKGIEIGM